MSEELGKIEKPPVADFIGGRKLYFIPLIYCPKGSALEYLVLFDKYWDQVESQLSNLEVKLGPVKRLYHELITTNGESGSSTIKELNDRSYQLVQKRLEVGAQLEATEDVDILSEYMDWGRCLFTGLQNQQVFRKVYDFYTEAGKKRHEFISKHIAETLKEDESAVLLFAEGHQLKFPPDIQLFYVAPPALDEIKRWLRDQEEKEVKQAAEIQEESVEGEEVEG